MLPRRPGGPSLQWLKDTFLTAILNNDIDKVRRRVSSPDSNIINMIVESDKKRTPLIIAIEKGYIEIAQLLIDRGANIHIKDNDGNTALIIAVTKGYTEIVRSLINKGAEINDKNNVSNSPLIISSYYCYIEIVKLLIDAGANINMQNIRNNTPLILAALNGSTEVVKILINMGVDLNMVNEYGNSGLMLAALNGYTDIVNILIKAGANVNIVNNEGNTALLFAALNSYNVISRLLIEAGANVNIVNNYTSTALLLAANKGNIGIVKLILERNPPLTDNIKNAIESRKFTPEIRELLIEHYSLSEPIPVANTPLNVANTTAYNLLELANVPIRDLLADPNILIIKNGSSYFTQYKSQIQADIASNNNIRFKCKRELRGAPFERDIEPERYFYIQGPGNFLVKENALESAIRKFKIIELLESDVRLDHVASYSSIQGRPGFGLDGRPVTIISADHCQAGTGQKVYNIRGINVSEGGHRRRRSRRRISYRKHRTRRHTRK